MIKTLLSCVILLAASSAVFAAGDYRGDARCPLPEDWSRYSEPYEPLEHPNQYPTFYKADWPGWSCSYQREDGVMVQFGDSRTPQKQWLDLYSGSNGDSK